MEKKIGTNIIKDKLNEIIERRNTVAHNTSMASHITKNDLNEAIKFLRIMAFLLDVAYKRQINFLCINAKRP